MAGYDRRPELTGRELEALRRLGVNVRRGRCYDGDAPEWQVIERLLQPLDDARDAMWCPAPQHRRAVTDAIGLVLLRCAQDGTTYWAWPDEDWARLIGASTADFARSWPGWSDGTVRPYVTSCAYLVGGFTAFRGIGPFDKLAVARRVFGKDQADEAMKRIADVLGRWGYRIGRARDQRLPGALCLALLLNRSPRLEDLTTGVFERLRLHPGLTRGQAGALFGIQKAVVSLGFCDPPPSPAHGTMPPIEGTAQPWAGWVERWYATSALTPRTRGMVRGAMAKAGRWLAAEHPEITEPGQWTRQTCAAWVAAIDRMNIGQYIQRTTGLSKRDGRPVSPQMKAGFLTSSRAFFRDCQEWEWIPRRFDPARALATPASIRALIGPNPRVIADDVWAKLLWAGLNIQAGDLPAIAGSPCYPMELIRAITLTWLFGGQRSDEIARLRVGCIRWQDDGAPVPGDSGEVLARDAVCLLDIPAHKTGTAFTKPVDPLVGKAIEAWQAVRPDQPKMLDRKTGEHVDLLFTMRARRVANTYINATIIPSLCRKAGVPAADARGSITSHRARSTIASQLYNAKEPMTLFELQAWLGHRSPDATRHYAMITPSTLARAYADAGYFARNVRTIEVLIDRDAVTSGQAAALLQVLHGPPA
jgi:integrase